MSRLFVDKTIEIHASPDKVWEVLTRREYTRQWASKFNGGSPFYIESDWEMGSPVFWKDSDGNVIVEGNVTALEPNKLLRFTVFDVRGEKPPVTEEDGITYKLSERRGQTDLQVLQGNFSAMTDGEKYREMSAEVWEHVLPIMKELSERPE
ncbi:MAG TPA: SRPBCC domain-containing protein [Anaerolineales bacterium]|nr:SRPBCC domain-containing protein [Anaerolineales bacterium]